MWTPVSPFYVWLLLNKCYNHFSGYIKLWSSERNTENTISLFYFKEESDYSEENTCENVLSTISVWAWPENTCGNESYEKGNKYIHSSAADLLHIRIGNRNWCKCGHLKNEAREIDCLCCREVAAKLLASAKILEREEVSRHPAFIGIYPTINHTS